MDVIMRGFFLPTPATLSVNILLDRGRGSAGRCFAESGRVSFVICPIHHHIYVLKWQSFLQRYRHDGWGRDRPTRSVTENCTFVVTCSDRYRETVYRSAHH